LLLLAHLAVWSALLSGLVALGADRRPMLLRIAAFGLLGLSGLAALLAGGWALLGEMTVLDRLPLGLPWLHWHWRLDPLAGLFLAVIGALLIPVSLFGPAYIREFEHSRQPLPVLGLFTGLFVAGMMLVVLADDAFAFMVAWEIMSLASYFLVAYQHRHAANRRAAFIYLLMAHVGALAILLAFGVLAGFAGSFTFEDLRTAELTPAWASVAFALALFGFGMKAGVVPLHVWLPEAHPVAPSHISALMSGAMLKVAVYGLIRYSLDLLPAVQWQWGVVMLIVGTASALLGVLYALMQHDLKRLLAYHSVENIGIIYMGLGLAMIFIGTGHPLLGVLGLVAALYHTVNHALFKALLFLGAGAILHHAHERDIEHMGGLIRRMPQTAFLFLVGCIAISGLPPLNGFVSEWLTFQTALQAPRLESGVLRALIPVSAAVLALTGALAAACFVKVYGVVFLGQPRSRHVRHAREVNWGMRAGMGLLAALCLLFGVLPTPVVEALNAVPQLLLQQGLPSATAHGWLWLTPVSPEVASYAAPLVVAAIGLAWLIGYLWLHRRGQAPVRRGDPWDCGFGPLSARMQYTSTAWSQPIRRIFAPVWEVHEQVDESAETRQPLRVASIHYHLHIADRFWRYLYEPIARLTLAAARRVGVIQVGSIRAYLAYSFFTLLVLLWFIT
jgi:formate hydrogenlyase subunit 3/multisubunit Na+/H+ antiporter MnhD subunit